MCLVGPGGIPSVIGVSVTPGTFPGVAGVQFVPEQKGGLRVGVGFPVCRDRRMVFLGRCGSRLFPVGIRGFAGVSRAVFQPDRVRVFFAFPAGCSVAVRGVVDKNQTFLSPLLHRAGIARRFGNCRRILSVQVFAFAGRSPVIACFRRGRPVHGRLVFCPSSGVAGRKPEGQVVGVVQLQPAYARFSVGTFVQSAPDGFFRSEFSGIESGKEAPDYHDFQSIVSGLRGDACRCALLLSRKGKYDLGVVAPGRFSAGRTRG